MKYDLKSDERLQIDDFCCSDCLVFDILDAVTRLRLYETIEIYAKAELIEEIFAGLISNDLGYKFSIGSIIFSGSEVNYDYVGEYCLSVNDKDEIWIEPAYRHHTENDEWKLFDSEATLAYVYEEDCKQDLVENLEKCGVPTLLFGFEEF